MQTLTANRVSRPATGKALLAVLRAALIIAAICLVCFAALGGRYLAFEYGHGDGGTVSRLLDRLS